MEFHLCRWNIQRIQSRRLSVMNGKSRWSP